MCVSKSEGAHWTSFYTCIYGRGVGGDIDAGNQYSVQDGSQINLQKAPGLFGDILHNSFDVSDESETVIIRDVSMPIFTIKLFHIASCDRQTTP